MASLRAVIAALALIVNDINLLLKGSIHDFKYIGAALVYLISVAVLVGQLKFFPDSIWSRHSTLCLFVEIPIIVLVLESSLRFIWWYIQEFISVNAENILAHLAEDRGLEGFICYMCCGKHNCSQIFTNMALKFLSFALLVATFTFVELK